MHHFSLFPFVFIGYFLWACVTPVWSPEILFETLSLPYNFIPTKYFSYQTNNIKQTPIHLRNFIMLLNFMLYFSCSQLGWLAAGKADAALIIDCNYDVHCFWSYLCKLQEFKKPLAIASLLLYIHKNVFWMLCFYLCCVWRIKIWCNTQRHCCIIK